MCLNGLECYLFRSVVGDGSGEGQIGGTRCGSILEKARNNKTLCESYNKIYAKDIHSVGAENPEWENRLALTPVTAICTGSLYR